MFSIVCNKQYNAETETEREREKQKGCVKGRGLVGRDFTRNIHTLRQM